MSFSGDISKFRVKANRNHEKIKKQSALQLYSMIIISTPVLSGRLRNNWFAEFGEGSKETTDETSKSPVPVIERARKALSITDAMQDFYFTNNLPYVQRIEYDGWSGQAPQGMFRINVDKWDKIVKEITKQVARE